MSIPKDQLINGIVIAISVMFLAKLFSPIVMSLFSGLNKEKKPKAGGTSLEAMIAHKEAMLRKGGPSSSGGINNEALAEGIKNKRLGKSEVENRYLDQLELNKESENEELIEDTQKVVSLFESLQWGEGQALSDIRQKFNKKFGKAPDQRLFLNNLKNLLKREVPLARATKNIPQHSEIVDLLITKTFLQSLSLNDEFTNELAKSVARKLRVSQASVLRAVAALLAKADGKDEKMLYSTILEAKDPFKMWDIPSRENLVNKCLLTEDKKYFFSIKELIEAITTEAHLFHTLSPLPELKGKNDLKGAFKIFGLNEDATADEIKKTYKKLSMLKHPDRMASKGIPKAFEDIAHENFTRIQSAYEILKNKES